MECVGCANRSCYDLTQHSKATKVDMSAKEDLAQPVSSLVACPSTISLYVAVLKSLTPPTLAYGGSG